MTPSDGQNQPPNPRLRLPPWTTPWAVAVLAAAALAIAVRYAGSLDFANIFPSRSDSPDFLELTAALANERTRPVAGRLMGGFEYAPPPSTVRGTEADVLSPDLRIAAARIEKRARTDDIARNRAALGVAKLILGFHDDAVELLESCAREE